MLVRTVDDHPDNVSNVRFKHRYRSGWNINAPPMAQMSDQPCENHSTRLTIEKLPRRQRHARLGREEMCHIMHACSVHTALFIFILYYTSSRHI